MDTCLKHGVICTLRCPMCHRGLCSRCRTRDGCCSPRCYKKRQALQNPAIIYGRRGPRPEEAEAGGRFCLAFVGIVVVLIGGFFAARALGLLPALPF